ncbi:MAG: membrane dipeptidase [Acidobacteria bacterium]|nr:MAG: membrane dipeptidase [Acidobacteriota bacterium]
MGSAYAEFQAGKKGLITPGKFADMVLLDQEIFSVPPECLSKRMRSLLALFVLAVNLCSAVAFSQDVNGEASRIQDHVLGIDGHNDTVQHIIYENVDLANRLPDGMIDIPRLREGGIHAPFFALWVPTYYSGSEAVRRTLDLRDAMQRVLDRHRDQIELATSAHDIERIVGQKKIAAVLTIEGGHQINNDLAVLRMYRHMGILAMTLTHFRNTDWGDSSTDKPEHNGLTDFGKQVVREMNAIGMIVDISHVSDKTFYDALQITTKPVIASHSSCRSLSDVPRNMTDDMLRALARNGGVVGVSFAAAFLNQEDADELKRKVSSENAVEPNLTGAALDERATKEYFDDKHQLQVGHATVEDAANCIDHAVKVAGIDHVGIGSDFDGISLVPRDLEDVSKVPNLTAALLKRGYSERDIRKIMGGNFLRVIQQVVGE